MTFRAQKTTPAAKQYVAKCNRRTPTPIQAVLPGVDVPPAATPTGQRLIRMMRPEDGPPRIARTLRHMSLAVRQLDRELGYGGNRRMER